MSATPPVERPTTLAMVWPLASAIPLPVAPPPGYAVRWAVSRSAFVRVQAAIGFVVNDLAWRTLQAQRVSPGLVLVERSACGTPVAVAAAQRAAPGWAELAWVAVDPAHRGRGLGRVACAALTRALLQRAEPERLWGSTQDHRLAALRIYLTLGFHPVYREEKAGRWRAVCDALGHGFQPRAWGWPERGGRGR